MVVIAGYIYILFSTLIDENNVFRNAKDFSKKTKIYIDTTIGNLVVNGARGVEKLFQ